MSGPDCQTLVVPLLDRNVLLPVNLRITLQVDLEFKISYRALFLQCRETILPALESTILSVNTNRKRPCQKSCFDAVTVLPCVKFKPKECDIEMVQFYIYSINALSTFANGSSIGCQTLLHEWYRQPSIVTIINIKKWIPEICAKYQRDTSNVCLHCTRPSPILMSVP